MTRSMLIPDGGIDRARPALTSLLSAAPPETGPSSPLAEPGRLLVELDRRGELAMPLPGEGATAVRWAALAGWGRRDLPLARLIEGHTDAVSIVAQAGRTPRGGALYGVWAARSGGTGAHLVGTGDAAVLSGTVRFCSGAGTLGRALVVALGPSGSRIVDLPLDAEGIRRVPESWHAVGMAASDSIDVEFHGVPAPPERWLGGPGFYTDRPGFWWGGGGVASVWLGGAAGVLDEVHAVLRDTDPDPHQRAQLGELHAALAAADALLVRTAALIDAEPGLAHRTPVCTARAAVERCCRTVLDVTPRLVGVCGLSRRDGLERRLADLGVYLRQHHGERDLADLGAAILRDLP
ncbi:MAG TPA: acyl-CoA dehydrogenase family protein [Pseudonocardia sp.]|uniref:acyl-CoA dehydrogenase family protein n=1 Tax=Pseudonocardia sp. TaxID=60912 RepID=UPI002F407ED9